MDKVKRTGKDALLAKSNNTALAMIQKAQATQKEAPAMPVKKKAQDGTLPKAEDKARTRSYRRTAAGIRRTERRQSKEVRRNF